MWPSSNRDELSGPLRDPAGLHAKPRRTILRRLRQHPAFPGNWLPSLRAAIILWRDYGHVRSMRTQSTVDANGNPWPWYTYPAIEFLSQLDFRDKTVFEYGSGMSTLYWAKTAARVVSVEDDARWFDVVRARAPANARVMLETDLSAFAVSAERTGEQFDIVVVDGPARGRTRFKCAEVALRVLRRGGLVILDNSDWLPESARLLREHGLLQVDMTGFAPICDHVQTTSLFFDRAFNVPPLGDRQPVPGRGAALKNWEAPFVPVPGAVIQVDAEPIRGAEDVKSLQFDTAEGCRSFQAFTYLGGDDSRCVGIVDLDRRRTLLSRHFPATAAEIDRLAGLSWAEFRELVNANEMRRYTI